MDAERANAMHRYYEAAQRQTAALSILPSPVDRRYSRWFGEEGYFNRHQRRAFLRCVREQAAARLLCCRELGVTHDELDALLAIAGHPFASEWAVATYGPKEERQ